MTLKAIMDAGAPADFFERLMASPDEVKAHPQFANVHKAIEKAETSDNPHLNEWAIEMNALIDNTAEGQALAMEQAGGDPLAGMMDKFKNIIAAIKAALSDGIQMSDLDTVMNAFNSSAENGAEQKFAAAKQGMENADARIIAAGEDGAAIQELLGEDNGQVASVIKQIQSIPG